MKLNEIQDLIKFVAKSGVSEVELETKDVKIVIKTPAGKKEQVLVQGAPAPAIYQASPVAQAPQPQAIAQDAKAADAKPPKAEDESKYITVKSPMIGTFYRSSAPDKPAFVGVGDDIEPGKTVCIIEAMKLFNEIESDVKGKIVKVLVNDATPVEYDQPLFLVDPS
ncbi:MAG TPA: acetyl-CoA carboxylase biotin carboxyl carrier protein [Bacteroidia bacterium]|jgi:acetyl-CoA carboxylase biotin carboxyl carrier protein|nr:acetyl-CoA carboxylase biotin carboxyl carrier protein [Bacteroidia bacterium]